MVVAASLGGGGEDAGADAVTDAVTGTDDTSDTTSTAAGSAAGSAAVGSVGCGVEPGATSLPRGTLGGSRSCPTLNATGVTR